MKGLTFTLVLLLGVPSAAGQFAPGDWFPLEVGNRWEFGAILEFPGLPADTLDDGTIEVVAEADVEGVPWFLLSEAIAFSDTVRMDAGRLLGRVEGQEVLMFDFNVEAGATYPSLTDPFFGTWTVSVSSLADTETLTGTFGTARQFDFDVPGVVDEEFLYVFAPGVGPVAKTCAWCLWGSLRVGVVGGATVVYRESGSIPFLEVGHPWPEPFQGRFSIPFSLDRAETVKIELLDALGRRVRVMDLGSEPAGRHQVQMNGTGLPAGPYFVRISAGNSVTARPVTLLK